MEDGDEEDERDDERLEKDEMLLESVEVMLLMMGRSMAIRPELYRSQIVEPCHPHPREPTAKWPTYPGAGMG